MSATQESEPKAAPPEPKANQPHPWAGRLVFYWRAVNQATGELAPLPATLLEPTRCVDGGWDLNFQRRGQVQGRQGVKFSEKPKAGCFTWPPKPAK
jgi:hypothetical protein